MAKPANGPRSLSTGRLTWHRTGMPGFAEMSSLSARISMHPLAYSLTVRSTLSAEGCDRVQGGSALRGRQSGTQIDNRGDIWVTKAEL